MYRGDGERWSTGSSLWACKNVCECLSPLDKPSCAARKRDREAVRREGPVVVDRSEVFERDVRTCESV